MVEAAQALFVRDGSWVRPTEWARGPWSPHALHGGPVAALVVGAAEACGTDRSMQLVRLTLELQRPVPLAPLELEAQLVRPGRRVQLVDVSVRSGGVVVATARALRMRVADGGAKAGDRSAVDIQFPAGEASDAERLQGPSEGVEMAPIRGDYLAFHNGAVEIRFVAGRFDQLGPATAWFRLRVPVFADEEPSPWQRAAVAADFGNGISAELPFATATFINPDLTIEMVRPPVGPWVALDARTTLGSPGIGWAESTLWDEHGRIGRSMQSLLVEALETPR